MAFCASGANVMLRFANAHEGTSQGASGGPVQQLFSSTSSPSLHEGPREIPIVGGGGGPVRSVRTDRSSPRPPGSSSYRRTEMVMFWLYSGAVYVFWREKRPGPPGRKTSVVPLTSTSTTLGLPLLVPVMFHVIVLPLSEAGPTSSSAPS